MKKYFLGYWLASSFLSIILSVTILLLFRIKIPGGDLFTQINISLLISFTLVAMFSLFKKLTIVRNIESAHLLHFNFTVHLLVFLLLQFSLLNIDRSRSFYVLSWADKGKISISGPSYKTNSVDSSERLNSGAIATRINEQIERKFLKIQGKKVVPTKSGKLLLYISNNLAVAFKLNNWDLNKK